MCGVPQHAAEAYLARLIRRGFRVAVAEQMEDPKSRPQGRNARRRSAATWCVWSPPARSPRRRCWKPAAPICCSALAQDRDGIGAAWLDVSTGLFETAALAQADLPGLLGRLEPAEILAPPGLPLGEWDGKRAPDVAPSPPLVARRRLAETFGVASVDAFGSFTDAEAIAALMAVDYVRATQAGTLPRLARPAPQGQHRAAGDGCGDARQPGDPSRARRRRAAHAVRHGAADADAGGGAAAGGVAGRAAHRSGGDRGAAGCVGVAGGGARGRRTAAGGAADGAGHRAGARAAVGGARRAAGPGGAARWAARGAGGGGGAGRSGGRTPGEDRSEKSSRRRRAWGRRGSRGRRRRDKRLPLPLREGVGGRGSLGVTAPSPQPPPARGGGVCLFRVSFCFSFDSPPPTSSPSPLPHVPPVPRGLRSSKHPAPPCTSPHRSNRP